MVIEPVCAVRPMAEPLAFTVPPVTSMLFLAQIAQAPVAVTVPASVMEPSSAVMPSLAPEAVTSALFTVILPPWDMMAAPLVVQSARTVPPLIVMFCFAEIAGAASIKASASTSALIAMEPPDQIAQPARAFVLP